MVGWPVAVRRGEVENFLKFFASPAPSRSRNAVCPGFPDASIATGCHDRIAAPSKDGVGEDATNLQWIGSGMEQKFDRLEMENAPSRGVCYRVSATGSVEFIEQLTDVKFGSVNRDA
jgi:hypothetical protein